MEFNKSGHILFYYFIKNQSQVSPKYFGYAHDLGGYSNQFKYKQLGEILRGKRDED